MAKPELGTKRACANCGAKFYDLNKDPIVCPKCGTSFAVAALMPRARAPEALRASAVKEEAPETQDAEFVSLEEADAEASGGKVAAANAEGSEDDLDLEESLDEDDEDAFIEETEEGDEDVTDIIGDVEDEEES